MISNTTKNKRIAKNTVMLYCRMIFVMVVSFATTRVVLQALGVSDYGLINVIGSVASMFVFLTTSVSVGCSRFLCVEIGRDDEKRLGIVFSMSLVMYVIIAIILFVLFETVGLWYVKTKLVTPEGRGSAVFVFYQLVVIQTIILWFSGPYSALIVSYENMSFYAFLSIADAVMKLLVGFFVLFVKTKDQLILYGCLLLISSMIHLMLHIFFVKRRYPCCRFRMRFDWKMLRSMIVFNGWRMIGVFSWTVSNIFINFLLNSFFGTVVNAARGIAMQIQFGARSLNENFVLAIRPQIIKHWANKDQCAFYVLLRQSVKISYFLVFIFTLPLFCEIPYILKLWLKEAPMHTISFSRLILVIALVSSIMQPLGSALQATGRVGLFEVSGAIINGLVLPISWLVLLYGGVPESVFVVLLVLTILTCSVQFMVVMREIKYSIVSFIKEVVLKLIFASIFPCFVIGMLVALLPCGFSRMMSVIVLSFISSIYSFYIIAMEPQERLAVVDFLRKKITGDSN